MEGSSKVSWAKQRIATTVNGHTVFFPKGKRPLFGKRKGYILRDPSEAKTFYTSVFAAIFLTYQMIDLSLSLIPDGEYWIKSPWGHFIIGVLGIIISASALNFFFFNSREEYVPACHGELVKEP